MDSYKKLLNNSLIFAIGSLGSKIISFILVPLYTYYLTTEQYGTVDLVVTTITMLVPVVSSSIFEAVLRFVMKKNKSRDEILTNSLFLIFIGFTIFILLYPLLHYYNFLGNNLKFLYIILFLQILERTFSQYARAIGKIKIFAVNGIILTFTTGVLSVLLIGFFDFGVTGYFISIIIANTISVLFLLMITQSYKDISVKEINIQTMKELLNYSVPMIPNSLMWWVVNASSRYFILFYVNIGANGLFAVASKIPSLINIINQVFSQAWQLSAIEEYENKNKSVFYSNVFTLLFSVLFMSTSALLIVIKLFFKLFLSQNYYLAWKVVPFLLLGTVFSSFSAFLGTNYIAAMHTKGVFKTSIYGGVISILLNFLLIPSFGMTGAGISSMISFFIMFIIRLYDTKQFIQMKINWKLFYVNLFIIFFQISILMFSFSMKVELFIEIILFLFIILINRNIIKPIFGFIKK